MLQRVCVSPIVLHPSEQQSSLGCSYTKSDKPLRFGSILPPLVFYLSTPLFRSWEDIWFAVVVVNSICVSRGLDDFSVLKGKLKIYLDSVIEGPEI